MKDLLISLLLAVITITSIELMTMNKAHAGLVDLQFGRYQVADTQWNVGACTTTATCQIYSKQPGVAYKIPWTAGQLSWAAGDYIKFEMSGIANYPYTARQYSSNGTIKATLGQGKVVNAGADYFFFMGSDNNTGQLFSGTVGMSGTAGVTWTGTLNPTTAQMNTIANNYSATPLSSGTTYTPPPTYTSNITPQQQARVNSATNLRDSITKNSIYIDQVGNNNTVTVTQNGQYNMVAGTGATATPIQGDYNNITIRQGDPLNSVGKNLIQMSVYGSSNTLNLNQGTDTNGNGNGSDVGGHMQYIIVSGSSNTVTTQQQNSGMTTNHYLETTITGNNNSQNFVQTGNGTKQVFATTTGNSNTLSSLQDGLGNHYLDVTANGDSNSAVVNQTGNTRNAATINLTNAGAPASVNLTQTGGQTYNISQSCTSACGTVTVRQGN